MFVAQPPSKFPVSLPFPTRKIADGPLCKIYGLDLETLICPDPEKLLYTQREKDLLLWSASQISQARTGELSAAEKEETLRLFLQAYANYNMRLSLAGTYSIFRPRGRDYFSEIHGVFYEIFNPLIIFLAGLEKDSPKELTSGEAWHIFNSKNWKQY